MQLPTVYEDSFLISGIMCSSGCGYNIENTIRDYLEKRFKDACIYISSSPFGVVLDGIYKYKIEIKSSKKIEVLNLTRDIKDKVKELDSTQFKIFEENVDAEFSYKNWINVAVNITALALIVILNAIFPPSLILSLGLMAISFVVTLYTTREYIFSFLKSINSKNFFSMSVTVTLGWALALVHAVYHLWFMPLSSSFAMFFMNFVMPLILVIIVNIMDEIKRNIEKKSKKVFLNGIQSLFPEMQDSYEGVKLSEESIQDIDLRINKSQELSSEIINSYAYEQYSRNLISENMLLKIKAGECFPVDGKIVYGHTYVDRSVINGEPATDVTFGTIIEAGCINIWKDVVILTQSTEYYSTVNRLILDANTRHNDDPIPHNSSNLDKLELEKKEPIFNKNNKFYYFYFGLLGAGVILSVILSYVFGTLTLSMMLQIMVGVLFSICPCTIGVAYYLPKLLKVLELSNNEIIINDAELPQNIVDFDTFIFDKTGTLTNESKVSCHENIDENLWKKIYQVETLLGRKHPIALAIQHYVEDKYPDVKNIKKNYVDFAVSEVCEIAANGVCAKIGSEVIAIGNSTYLKSRNIQVDDKDIYAGTCTFIAVNDHYVGNIEVQHALRPGILDSLHKLKYFNPNKPKKLVMLTGDRASAANSLNSQCNNIFGEEVYSEKKPYQKSQIIKDIFQQSLDKNICFIGDGMNDTLCAKEVRALGGVSISISAKAKAAFFTDMSLNESLDYFFLQKQIDVKQEKILKQNRWIMVGSAIIFLTFLISFEILGIGVSPLIPMTIMFASTVFTLFNSYRMQVITNNILNSNNTLKVNKLLSSDVSIGLLSAGSISLVASVLVASISTLHLSLPLFVFNGGLINIVSGSFLVVSIAMLAAFVGICCLYMLKNSNFKGAAQVEENVEVSEFSQISNLSSI